MESDEPQMAGPFITVVSVDGGVESGNKLTVITPLELNNEQSRLSVVHEDVEEEDEDCEDQVEQPSSRSNNNQKLTKSKNHGAYVTVLSLGKRDEVGAAAATGKNKKKSVVNICAGPPESTPHVVAILSKDKQQQQQSKARLSSVVDINNENLIENPAESDAWIVETVTVYKLPGERLGFGLRFDGGVANPLEKVKGLFIQSCAEDSPAARTKASWGHLIEGDEILEIQNSPVANMTRMDCIQSLKEASVALTLLLRHFYSAEERMLRRRTAGQDLCQNNLIMVRDNNLNNNNKAHELRDHDGEEEKEEEYAEAVPAERVQPQPQPRLRHSYSNNNVKDMEAATDIYLETPLIINNFTVPVPPPRKLRGPEMEEMNGDAAEVVLSMVKIKPPSGFADDDSSSFKSHSPTLPPEAARVYTLAIIDGEHKGPYHSESTSMCESDETGSTRSTVVSRLSMLSFNNNHANDTKRTDQSYYGHEGIEGVTTPSCLLKGEEEDDEDEEEKDQDEEDDDDDQVVDGIPLAPPLHFQDGKSEMMGMRRNNEKLAIRSTNNENAALIGKAAALIGNEKLGAMRRDGETIRSNNNNNNDMDSFNPQLIEITDDDELALLAEQLGLDEEEDEAEELRKFLLLEEKIKHIHDKGEDEDDEDEEEVEDGSSKEDDANVLSTLPQQQQQQWDIDRIAEEDEKEEDEDDDEKVDTNVLTTTHPVINETTRLTADNSHLNEQTKELIERTNGISGATAAAAASDEMTRKTASSSSQGITVTMTQATVAASQPEKDQDDDEDQINADEPNFQVNIERDATIVEQHDSVSHVLSSSVSVENPDTIQSQDIQWTVKVTSKGAHSAEANNVIADGLDQLDEGSSSAFAIQERQANGPEELKDESIRRRIEAKVHEEGSSASAENIQSQSRPEDTETNNATVEQIVHADKNSEEKDTLYDTINQGQSEESKGMEGSHELYHHPFSPPTFSRLPPDGDEFPNSWSDENKTSSPAKTTTYDKSHYRTEIVKTIMKVPPPPVPSSEPPAEEDSPPPPLPSTIPPKVLARRSSSVEDRKKLFTTTNNNNAIVTSNVNNNNNKTSPKVVARGAEPSKKSVRDKIAMFSSRTSSSSSSASTSMEDESKGTARHVTSSLPRSAAGSAFSKSSDNLLSSQQHQPPPSSSYVILPSKPSNSTWNNSITQSTYDLRKNSITESDLLRKSSITSAEFDLRKNSMDSNDFSPVRKNSIDKGLLRLNGKDYSKLNERSQSMLDVGQENLSNSTSYHRISATYRLSNNITGTDNTGLSPSSTSLIESRRKANLTKLRGLVIPDKAIVAPVSSSVADLPTIVSKDAVIVKPVESPRNILLSRTESLDSSYSAKGTAEPEDNTTDWKIPSLPKYSPAFKRRGLSYQSPLTSTSQSTSSSTYKASPVAFNTLPTNYKLTTPEPKSLESLTSPHSDSSFEFNAANNNGPTMPNNTAIMKPPPIVPRKLLLTSTPKESAVPTKVEKSNTVKGKLEDSDNDSAVSSSRSSISHGLSPPNSPTPEESSSTPDPEVIEQNREDEEEEEEEEEEEAEDGGETEDSNSDEGWRVLKPQSVEAINRKNVLASAKFSSGVVRDENKSRRSDDEAGYADGEAEDTESSCSELDVSSHRRRSSVTRPVVRRKVEAEDVLEATTTSSHSTQSSVDLADMSSSSGSNLAGQSPLQAIYDMEVQMAYINEICDALPTRSDSGNRYFSRRDSEATVIERPITASRKNSDTIDAAERRSRNRSSSGNESDFSSSISVGSQSTTMVTTTITSTGTSEDKWSVLEKKYSKSLTAVNLVGSPKSTAEPTIKPQEATPPVNNTATAARSNNNNSTRPASNNIDGLEKTVTRMMEKSGTMETKVKAKIIGAAMPRGRNDFKSLSEKWQQLSSQPTTKPTVPVKPPVFEKPATLVRKSEQQQEYVRTTMTTTVTTTTAASPAVKEEILAGDAGTAWDTNEGLAGEDHDGNGEMIVPLAMSTTKRSVSVNDIRKAFEKAEMAVNTRDDNCAGMKDDETSGKEAAGGLSLPSAHFRVSSFDSTTSEESSATTPAGLYGSVNSLVSSAPRDPYGSITSLASSTSLISPQELQQLIDEANQSLEEAGTPSHEVCVIILHREYVGGSLGITLAGGADYETKEITVHKVLTGSIADRDGRVHRGDRVLSINGKNTKGLTHREALNLLKAPRTEVVLVVSRGRSGANGFQTIEESSSVTLDRAVEPLLNGSLSSLLENDEEGSFKWGPIRTVILIKDGAGLGFSLEGGKGSIHGDKPLTVKKIFVGGPAEKCGELKVGDLIVSISGVNMSSKSRTEAWNFMKKLGDGEVKINVRSPAS